MKQQKHIYARQDMQQKILIKSIQYNSTSKKQHCYQCLQQPL